MRGSLKSRILSSLTLSAVGDAVGFRNGNWEFERSGEKILKEYNELGGIKDIDLKEWRVSDDTIMHLATARAISVEGCTGELDEVMEKMREEYINCKNELMNGRGYGQRCMAGILELKRLEKWDQVRYERSGGGCGGSMRSSCIGLRFFGEENRDKLIQFGIESGRLTHNQATGFLGSLASSVFTAYAMENKPVLSWGRQFLDQILPEAKKYLLKCKRDIRDQIIFKDMTYFYRHFEKYLEDRGIREEKIIEGPLENYSPKFPKNFWKDEMVDEMRYSYWEQNFSYNHWPGASGDDSVIIAYDCLLAAGESYEKAIKFSACHGGDSDSTAAICMAWWGAIYGFQGVKNIQNLEFREEINRLAQSIHNLVSK